MVFPKSVRYLIPLLLFIQASSFGSQEGLAPKIKSWPFDGMRGRFDLAAIQRGFKVYKEVCSACHSIKQISFNNLVAIGFSDEEIKSLAAGYEVEDGPNEEGLMFKRPGRPPDKIPGPFANEKAARASNNGALPPDLSLIVKARKNGPNYVYSLLTGFSSPPPGFKLGENMYYNPYFAAGGNQLAMSPPLVSKGQVQFDDGTEATIEQMASDVVNFLQWTAEPEMEERKSLGIRSLIFTAILFVLLYFANKAVWSDIKKKK
jgi:ubiquinol-cytochrome c reductase cytochrome c1 subunit